MLIIGAGLSGIGLAATLSREAPGTTFAILEARGDLGGTWDLHRYPGIRSDSDLYTFGFGFKPWRSDNAIAGGAEILAYLREAAEENGVLPHIRFHRRALEAHWDGQTALWTVIAEGPEGREVHRARFLFGATGYYDYDNPNRPHFPGEEAFGGPIIHPQHWPEELDCSGKRVAVIGSGATAVTIVPALAQAGAQVTQVQRTPSYLMPMPAKDKLALWLQRKLPAGPAYRLARRWNLFRQRMLWLLCKNYPQTARGLIRKLNIKMLPEGFDVDRHFSPPYDPWRQRLCAVPDGDFFRALRSGKAGIVTGAIARLEAGGIVMEDGTRVPADVIVSATGLNILVFGRLRAFIDGAEVSPGDHFVFKGFMLDGVPNFAFALGYAAASWTLKVDLVCGQMVKLLAHMKATGQGVVTPRRPAAPMAERPLMDLESGYLRRGLGGAPKLGDHGAWAVGHVYAEDAAYLKTAPIDDPALDFAPAPAPDPAPRAEAAE